MKHMTYVTTAHELEEITGMSSYELWEYVSLDDWDYALVLSGKIPKDDYMFTDGRCGLLRGCYDNHWKYIKKIDMTIGMAYHA
jgi:hypothetical protein